MGLHPEISVVAPAWNERESLRPFVQELVDALRSGDNSFEICVVDDGSSDGSGALLRQLEAEFPELVVLLLPEHVGKASALLRAFEGVRGRWVVTMDADLQDEPTEIPRLLQAASRSTMSIGVRDRADNAWRRFLSRTGWLFRNLVLKDGVTDIGCPLRVIPREALHDLPDFEGLHRFLPALLQARGLRVRQLPIRHRPRRFGRSKYTAWGRGLRGAWHLLFVAFWIRRMRDASQRQSHLQSM